MNKDQHQRLEPFLYRKGARQRLILFLIAEGFTVSRLVAMTVAQLRALALPVDFEVCRDEALNARQADDRAFCYPNGATVPHSAYYRLMRQTAQKVLRRPMSQESFRAYMQSPEGSRK